MLHPSYTDLMRLVNSEVESGDTKVVNSRYSIVLATAKRARQLTDGVEPLVNPECPKPLSIAIDELSQSKIRILSEEEAAAVVERKKQEAVEKEAQQEEILSFSEEEEATEAEAVEAEGEE